MIHVPRAAAAPAAVAAALAKALRDGRTELQAARAYYAQQPPPTKAFAFARYKEPPVCRELDRLYHEKCAYCESVYRAVDASDVEHFRPKGAVSDDGQHPGYWWLAATWSNLLPSCPACNQRRRQLLYQPGMTLEEFERLRQQLPDTSSGKGNAFPLSEPQRRARRERQRLSREDPLLINPSQRDPAAHLQWVFEWDRARPLWLAAQVLPVLLPRSLAAGPDPYGKATVAIFGLNRAGLLRERMARVRLLQQAALAVVEALEDLAQAAPRERALREQRLQARRTALAGFAATEEPYTSMARAFIALFEAEVAAMLPPAGPG